MIAIFWYSGKKMSENLKVRRRSAGSNRRLDGRGRRVSGIGCSGRFDQKQMDLLGRDGAVVDALRHDIEFARTQMDLAVSEPNRKVSLHDIEEVVGVGVGMPDKLALELDHHDVVAIK